MNIDPILIFSKFTDTNDIKYDDALLECPSMVAPLLIVKQAHLLFSSAPKNSNQKLPKDYVTEATQSSLKSPYGMMPRVYSVKNLDETFSSQLLMDIGLNRVLEWTTRSEIHKLSKKVNDKESAELLKAKQQAFLQIEAANEPFKPGKISRCSRCYFKTEFMIALDEHLQYIHKDKRGCYCNWCDFKTKDIKQILNHCLVEHNKICRIAAPLLAYCCTYCPIESNSKRKMDSHIARCKQIHEKILLLAPESGKGETPCITSRPITTEHLRLYKEYMKTVKITQVDNSIRLDKPPMSTNMMPRRYLVAAGSPISTNLSSSMPNFSVGKYLKLTS